METKLTLKLDQDVILAAKHYAERHDRTLSKLVENYFRGLALEDTDTKLAISPLVRELSGVISVQDLKGADYLGYLESKYE